MKYIKYLVLAFIISFPLNSFAQLTQSSIGFLNNFRPDREAFAYYDLRDRSSYIQVTNVATQENPLCIHLQIFQQDRGCSELDFEDELTINDTVVYDLDNLIRNDGSEVPINLNDDSYGYVAISAFSCIDRGSGPTTEALLGNFRIIDDTGYEYRVNLLTNRFEGQLSEEFPNFNVSIDTPFRANIIIPFNTIDGANQADIVAFVLDEDRTPSGSDEGQTGDTVYNEEVGVRFDVFQIDENEERLSCDQKTIGCGPSIELNYGINEDYPNSKEGPKLCEGAGLLPGQTNGYISLENARMLSPLDADLEPFATEDFEFICLAGFNNGNGTGSMDTCQYMCATNNANTISDCSFDD